MEAVVFRLKPSNLPNQLCFTSSFLFLELVDSLDVILVFNRQFLNLLIFDGFKFGDLGLHGRDFVLLEKVIQRDFNPRGDA